MTMENPPFEDVCPIEMVDFPACHVTFQCFLMCFFGKPKLTPKLEKNNLEAGGLSPGY